MSKYPRGLLAVLLVVTVALLGAATTLAATTHSTKHFHHAKPRSSSSKGSIGLPVAAIEKALQIKGTISHGVLSEGFARTDINDVTIHGVPIKPDFEINGEWDFQSLGHGRAFENGDMPVKPSEVDPVISAIVENHLVFEAFHQHMYDFTPIVYFIHIRAEGNPVTIARELHNVLKATSTPLPQAPPSNPTSPLDAKRLERMLHGFDYDIGDDGIVTVDVAPAESVRVDGIHVNPRTNIMTNISFEPLNSNGSQTAVIGDFAQTWRQVMPFEQVMRVEQNWDIGCLYNQETAESPQLFFSHQFKVGDPYVLAAEIRQGLNHTAAQ